MKKETPVLDKKRLERLERRRATRKLRYSSYREIHEGEEKAESFKTSAKRLWGYIWEQKIAFIIVVITCAISSVFSVLGPDYIGQALDLLNEQVEKIGANVRHTGRYPGWDFLPESDLRDTYIKKYKESKSI